MIPIDSYDMLITIFQWQTLVRVLLLVVGFYVCARVGLAAVDAVPRRPGIQWAISMAVVAGACLCAVAFLWGMKEDYAYVVLGSECEENVPYAMRWLVKHGGKGRLIRTVRAPFDEDDFEMHNTRLYAALVLAKKDPAGSRQVLPSVTAFTHPHCGDPSWVFGTNRYSFPASGTEILKMEWNDGTTRTMDANSQAPGLNDETMPDK